MRMSECLRANITALAGRVAPLALPLWIASSKLPLEAVLRWVLALTDPGDCVFDPFLGSGTTGAACELSERRWGGVEMVEIGTQSRADGA